MKAVWKLQDAKAQFSKVVEGAFAKFLLTLGAGDTYSTIKFFYNIPILLYISNKIKKQRIFVV